jgi:hypothetical protein
MFSVIPHPNKSPTSYQKTHTWSAMRLNWRNSIGVSLGSGVSSVTPALKGTSPVTGFDVAVAGTGLSELDEAIVVGTGEA